MLNFVIVTNKNGKNKAFPWQKHENENLIELYEIPNVDIIQYVGSRKRAAELAWYWNEAYRRNGTLEQ